MVNQYVSKREREQKLISFHIHYSSQLSLSPFRLAGHGATWRVGSGPTLAEKL